MQQRLVSWIWRLKECKVVKINYCGDKHKKRNTTLYDVAVLLFKIQSLFSWLKKDVFLFVKHTAEVATTFTFITHEKSKKKQMYFNTLRRVKILKISDFLAEITRWNIMTWVVVCFTLVESKSSGLGKLFFVLQQDISRLFNSSPHISWHNLYLCGRRLWPTGINSCSGQKNRCLQYLRH